MNITEHQRLKTAVHLIARLSANASGMAKTDHDRAAFDDIYRMAHAADSPRCRKNHPKWTGPIDAAIRHAAINKNRS